MSLSLAALAAAAALSAAPAAPARRVAVLDFGASWSAECVSGAKLAKAEREQCEILRLFADEARGGALAVLRPPAYVVMTRENTAQILKDMGGQCSEGECEVETARLLGASVVVSGAVTLLEETYLVSLKVHDVTTAALLGTGKTRAKTKLEAFDNVRAETERMLKESVGLDGIAAAPAAPPARAPVATPVAMPVVAPAERATPVPSPDPSPAGSPEAARPRRWYVGLDIEMIFGSGLPENGISSWSNLSRTDAVSAALLFRAGFRPFEQFSFEAIAGSFSSESSTPPPLEMGISYWATFGGAAAVWHPLGNRYVSLAAGAGLASVKVEVTAYNNLEPGTDDRGRGTGLFGVLGLRGAYPMGPVMIGAKLDVFTLRVAEGATASVSTGETSFVETGARLTPVLAGLSVQYGF